MKQSLQDHRSCGSIWQHRDMRIVLPARSLSYLGDAMAFVLLSLRLAESGEPAMMTAFFVAFSLPLFLMAPVAGRIVDEYDSRLVLAAAGGLQVIASVGLAWGPSLPVTLGFVVLLQVGQSITGPSWTALVPRIVGDDLVGKAVGMQQSLAGLAGLGGAAVGGVLYGWLGYHQTMLVDTATFAGLVLAALAVQTRRGRRLDLVASGREPGGTMAEAAADGQQSEPVRRSGLRVIRSEPLLRLLVPALLLFVIGAEAVNVVEVFLVTDELGASSSVYGLSMAAFALGQIAGPLLAGRVSEDAGRVGWAATAAAGIGLVMIAIGLTPTVWLALPLFVVCGVCGGSLNALLGTLTVTRTPERVRGGVIALVVGGSRGCSVLAMVLGGVSGQLVGARATFVLCGVLSVLVAVVIRHSRRGLDRPSAVPDPVPAPVPA
jgi:MFS family permease